MNVGTISYEVRSGLGILARDFQRNGIVNRVFVINHPVYERQHWYTRDIRYSYGSEERFLDGLDTLLILENAFSQWPMVKRAKERGIRIVLMTMYEYTQFPSPVEPDLLLCPSALDLRHYGASRIPRVQVTIPVSVPWRLREKALTFVHNGGHGGKDYRNGTPEVLKAMEYVKSPIRLIVRGQPDSGQMRSLLSPFKGINDGRIRMNDCRAKIDVQLRNVDDSELWNKGDVFLFPEKFNGLSLPLQEAYASGMLVMCGSRFPMTEWLPCEPMFPVHHFRTKRLNATFDEAIYDPEKIAETIDAWYGRDISHFSQKGREWAEDNTWEKWKPRYLELLGG